MIARPLPLITKEAYLSYAAENYELARAIVADPARALAEAKRIHDGSRWSSTQKWKEAVDSTAREMREVAEKVVRGGKGATYVIKRRRSDADDTSIDVTLGCTLLLHTGGAGYAALFTSDDY